MMLQNFTTKAANRIERSRQWRSLTRAEHVEFSDDREASIRGGDFGHLRLCIVSMGSHHVTQSRMAQLAGHEPTLKFLFQESGNSTIRQGGLDTPLQAGQWCAIRKDLAYEIEAPTPSRQLCLTLRCGVVPNPGRDFVWWRKPRCFLSGATQILHASASASIMSGDSLTELDCQQLGEQLGHMIGITLRSEREEIPPDVREKRRRAILEFIDRNLSEPDLGVGQIAHEFSCSSRTIHKLFEGQAHTVVRAIWDRRLERCRDEMIDPVMAAQSITQIAHLWGFSDSQHFSRAFKTRYSITPREYRARHLAS